MNSSVFPLDSQLEEAPPAPAEAGPISEGQGRDCDACLAVTRSVVLRMLPWLVLAFCTVLGVTILR
jgi:hypothetical protein